VLFASQGTALIDGGVSRYNAIWGQGTSQGAVNFITKQGAVAVYIGKVPV